MVVMVKFKCYVLAVPSALIDLSVQTQFFDSDSLNEDILDLSDLCFTFFVIVLQHLNQRNQKILRRQNMAM